MNKALDFEVCRRTYGDLAAAGTSEVKSPVVDMDGFDELTYQIVFGDNVNGSVVTIAAKENTTATNASGSSAITLTLYTSASGLGTAATITSGNLVVTCATSDTDEKIVLVTLKRSSMTKRYQFVSVTPATQNAVIASITAEQRCAKAHKVTMSSDVIAAAYAVS